MLQQIKENMSFRVPQCRIKVIIRNCRRTLLKQNEIDPIKIKLISFAGEANVTDNIDEFVFFHFLQSWNNN